MKEDVQAIPKGPEAKSGSPESTPASPFGGLSINFWNDPDGATDGSSNGLGAGMAIAFDAPSVGAPSPSEPFGGSGGPHDDKLVIVGSGPAGVTAAIYAARAN